MAENSKIEWTDHTFNPWRGCAVVHEGCANCYAWRESKRFPAIRGVWGPNGTRVMASAEAWRQPLKWNRKAKEAGKRARVFCASLADVFEDWQGRIIDHEGHTLWLDRGDIVADDGTIDFAYEKMPLTMNDLRVKLFKLIDATPYLDWQLVTKRPENIRRMWQGYTQGASSPFAPTSYERGSPTLKPRANVWLLTSVSNQKTFDTMILPLLRCRDLVPVLGLSAEPLLGEIIVLGSIDKLDWIIAGGESGPGARPMDPRWCLSLRDQCASAGVPFFFKQWGEWAPTKPANYCKVTSARYSHESFCWGTNGEPYNPTEPDQYIGSTSVYRVGKKAAGRELDGKVYDEFPKAGVAV